MAQSSQRDIEIIKGRILSELLDTDIDEEEVSEILSSQRADGTWPDIDYVDVSRTGFEHRFHTGNMVKLSQAYQKRGNKYRKKKEVLNAISKALENWVQEDYFCDNWWHNQIGTPNNLVSVMLLVGDQLPEDLVQAAQPMIGRAHLNASGARPSGDRIKIAGILAKNLLFNEDYEQFDEVIRVIEGEIKFSEGRGMQYDYSFHHRVDRVNNTLSYGLGYADAFVEWAVYTAGTQYAFSNDKMEQLVDYYLDGICKTMVFGKYPDPGAKNRSVAREGALKPMGAGTPKKIIQATDYRREEINTIIKTREEDISSYPYSHNTFYWHSEHFTFQRPEYFASVRMFSTRNHNMEVPYNSEGLKNHHRGDGANHVLVHGEEYLDIYPVMDYQKVPGATIMQKEQLPTADQIQKLGTMDVVGAVTDGMYGAVAFDFRSPHDPLESRKSWFFFDEGYVCLGAGIQSKGKSPVFTTLNQHLLRGEVVAHYSEGEQEISDGEHKLPGSNWIYADGVGYILPGNEDLYLNKGPVTGNWRTINEQSSAPKEDVTKRVLSLWLDHGAGVKDGDYAYMVIPTEEVESVKHFAQSPPLEIIRNDKNIQAVSHNGKGIIQVVSYQHAELELPNGLDLIMHGPGQLILHFDGKTLKKVAAADPSRKLGKLHFSLTQKIDSKSPALVSHWNPQGQLTEMAVTLPTGNYAGQSTIVEL
jgi:chondroitin AC lyase